MGSAARVSSPPRPVAGSSAPLADEAARVATARRSRWLVAALSAGAVAAFVPLWQPLLLAMFAAIVAHATTNAALGGYVLVTREWHYW